MKNVDFFRQWRSRDQSVQSVMKVTMTKKNVLGFWVVDSFCFSCLERLLHGNSIDCPKCRHAVAVPTGVQGLLKNFALLDIVKEAPKEQAGHTEHTGTHDCEACDEKHPATFCCLDCRENFCKTAAQFHKRSKASRDHRVVSLEELKANPQLASVSVFCPEHNDQFRFFDKDCGRVICRDCYALIIAGTSV